MPIIESYSLSAQADSRTNREFLLGQLEEFRTAERLKEQSEREAETKFTALGKMIPRKRVEFLLDPGSPFLEIAAFAGYKMEDDKDGSTCGGGVIGGIGLIHGRFCMILASNSAIKGGVISPSGLKKNLRLQQIALENKLPVVSLAESGGANLNYAAEVFVEGARCFANQARMSALGLIQLTIVHGNATAGGAYQPGLSDYMIVVRNQSKLFLAGPPLLKAATGEIARDEDLGGGEMHAAVSGTAEYIAENDADAIAYARTLLAQVFNEPSATPQISNSVEPLYPREELLGLIPKDIKTPFDMRDIWARIIDGSEFMEFKPGFDQGTICGHGKIMGLRCGLIGNNAPITVQGAVKAAQFIQLCDQAGLPLLFFHNTTGFLVGTESERNGIIKHGSKMIQAMTNARVPKISLLVGGSYGAGNYAMCGRGFDPRFIFSWPNSRTAVMGGAQAGMVLRTVTEEKFRKLGQAVDEKKLAMMEEATRQKLDLESSAIFGSARLWDDGVIDPRDSRQVLGLCLLVCQAAEQTKLAGSTFGVSRF
ncbi:MAG TPA: carboxyl transferase domain-containing protein [Oligoflexus sp.]|uniref:acyl-CoA carboxylase subunit beta n=1 Tax=Oligoflexus sp. TaxID=1971216 RepID=UPI002D727947|nr:carboxyl transferase domain-containing protein [Oligoflexus sp.]HYX37635.1 carboxyl transferase domain-containing protein [Oligoflexus sp.]